MNIKEWSTDSLEEEKFEINQRLVDRYCEKHPEDEDVIYLERIEFELNARQEEAFNKL